MAGKARFSNAVAVGDVAGDILDPVLRRRAGISVGLVQSWDEIVGESVASRSRPEKIVWPRRASEEDPFEPATLVIACEGAAAMRIQHQTGEIIGRINAFLGFAAIGRVRIVQKAVAAAESRAKPKPRALTPDETRRIESVTRDIEDDGLRLSLEKLGQSIVGSRKK